MSGLWITPERLFDGGALREGLSLRLEAGRVVEIGAAPEGGQRVAGCIAPGFVDLQVNGGGGVLLNDAPTVEGMERIVAAHRGFGTTAILPTLITDRAEVMEAAAEAALSTVGRDDLLGIHFEGPHIAVAKRGTHKAAHIRPLDGQTMGLVTRLRQAGVAVMVTLAPEVVAPEEIAALARTGAIVSIGHTDASAEVVARAIEAGATCGTHLFNAMSPMTSRAPGAVGAILDAGIGFGLICDGHHVDDRMVRLALRAAAAPERAFLVSDAMPTVGGPTEFLLQGQRVRLSEGRLVNEEGNLAGAHVTQGEGVARLVGRVGLPLEAALRMAISTPAGLIGRPDLARIEGRSVEELVCLDRNGTYQGLLSDNPALSA